MNCGRGLRTLVIPLTADAISSQVQEALAAGDRQRLAKLVTARP